jgi:hypothetical protein
MVEKATFPVGVHVRFIGTDTIYTVTQYDKDILQYQVQCGNDRASRVWVSGIYLEQAEAKAGLMIHPVYTRGDLSFPPAQMAGR